MSHHVAHAEEADWEHWRTLGSETVQCGQFVFSFTETKTWEQARSFDIGWSQAALLPPVTTDITQADWKLDLCEWPRGRPRLCADSGACRLTGRAWHSVLLRFVNEAVAAYAWDKRRAIGKIDVNLSVSKRSRLTCCDPVALRKCNSH